MIQNKAPGKDVSAEDMIEKFPLASKKNNEHYSKFEVSGVPFGDSLIPIMAGPNMVESEELIVKTAINVKKAGAHFLRGGAFKPLSFPYRSEKYTETREDGIKWLGVAKKESGIGIITEVMEEKYLDFSLRRCRYTPNWVKKHAKLSFDFGCSKNRKTVDDKEAFWSIT